MHISTPSKISSSMKSSSLSLSSSLPLSSSLSLFHTFNCLLYFRRISFHLFPGLFQIQQHLAHTLSVRAVKSNGFNDTIRYLPRLFHFPSDWLAGERSIVQLFAFVMAKYTAHHRACRLYAYFKPRINRTHCGWENNACCTLKAIISGL